jgi:two-component system CheB/CheR fusion protein
MPSKKSTPKAKKPASRKKVGKASDQAGAKARAAAVSQEITTSASSFPIVGVGASAGGLEALEAFFKEMPANTGLAFVLVVHLDPTHISILPELLQKRTRMSVRQVKDGTQVEPDHVYVIPPNKDLSILHGRLHLMELSQPRGVNLPIDSFFRSLA